MNRWYEGNKNCLKWLNRRIVSRIICKLPNSNAGNNCVRLEQHGCIFSYTAILGTILKRG